MNFVSTVDKEGLPINKMELKSILLVDDDKQLASALQWILADENFLVDVAHDGEEAMQKFMAGPYDAIVCDLMMPRLRGDQFYAQATAARPDSAPRFIFITGHPSEWSVDNFLKQSGVTYLVKPFPMEALIHSVKESLMLAEA